jgi:hypothetical protein
MENQDSNPGYGSGMNKPGYLSESLETIFWVKILNFFDTNPGSASEKELQFANEIRRWWARKPGPL